MDAASSQMLSLYKSIDKGKQAAYKYCAALSSLPEYGVASHTHTMT